VIRRSDGPAGDAELGARSVDADAAVALASRCMRTVAASACS
jgi:hypothetical protein